MTPTPEQRLLSHTARPVWMCATIMVVALGGCQHTAGGSTTHPAWSPDGQHIAFISNREGVRVGRAINFEIYRAAADGSGQRRLTVNNDFDADVDWSPDGTRLVFKSYQDQNDEVYVMDADGANPRNLTRSPASDGGATWSPDGGTLLFQSDRGGTGKPHLYLMDADGSNVRRLAHDPGPGHSPDFSPDGRQILFVSDRNGRAEIYLANADGSRVRRLTDDPADKGYPRWSPDGRTIAYTAGSFATDQWSVILMEANGAYPRQLIDNTDSGNVAWSPDGRQLLFGRYQRYVEGGGDNSELFLLDVATKSQTRVTGRTP